MYGTLLLGYCDNRTVLVNHEGNKIIFKLLNYRYVVEFPQDRHNNQETLYHCCWRGGGYENLESGESLRGKVNEVRMRMATIKEQSKAARSDRGRDDNDFLPGF